MDRLQQAQEILRKTQEFWKRLSPDAQKLSLIVIAVLLFGGISRCSPSSPKAQSSTPAQASAPAPRQRIFLATTEAGYSLWKQDDGCLIVKDITEVQLQQMGTDWNGFKQSLKSRYGFQCVFVE